MRPGSWDCDPGGRPRWGRAEMGPERVYGLFSVLAQVTDCSYVNKTSAQRLAPAVPTLRREMPSGGRKRDEGEEGTERIPGLQLNNSFRPLLRAEHETGTQLVLDAPTPGRETGTQWGRETGGRGNRKGVGNRKAESRSDGSRKAEWNPHLSDSPESSDQSSSTASRSSRLSPASH